MDVASDLAPTGVLRASINLGNPVLAQGTPTEPTGVTVDIARELGARLGVEVELHCFQAALASFEALTDGRADVAFLAIEPARAAQVSFTAPYAVIEGVFAVSVDSPLMSASEVDRPGVRIGVKNGSAYDLFLSRSLTRAELVRGREGTAVFLDQQLDVAAGIRAPVAEFAEQHGLRLIEPAFMQIEQAVATTQSRSPDTLAFLRGFIEDLKASGFVAAAFERSGRRDAVVAPPAVSR